IGNRLDPAGGTHHVTLAVLLDGRGTPTEVIGFDSPGDVCERNPQCDQLRRVGLDMVLLHVAADSIDSGDAWHALELRSDDPVLHSAQVGGSLELAGEALPLGREISAVAL